MSARRDDFRGKNMLPHNLMKFAVKFMAVLWLLGGIPACVTAFGYEFIPSVEWASRSRDVAVVFGLFFAIFSVWCISTSESKPSEKKSNNILGFLAGLSIGYIAGRNIIVVVVPMMFAIIGGHEVQLPYTVARADGSGVKFCRSPVEFQGLPFILESACNISDDFRRGISPGTKIMVTGRGSSFGLFPQNLRKAD